jgi:integrase
LLKWRWDDTDLGAGVAVFRDVKNSRDPSKRIDRQIGLSPRALEILQGLPKSLDGRIIPMNLDELKRAFERARKAAGLEHFRLHDLRHEMASSRHEDGWSPVEVMAQGGWRDPKSMARYSNLCGQHLAARFRQASDRRST